ncbi:hypothetical protein CI102_4676 [Trichoderma harzianum]|nr:hypothetical protein CI102_4676 [Trichoderma harzianum]
MEGVHTATAQQQRGRYDTIRCSGYCSLCIRNIELRLHLLRTLVQITPSVPAPCKQKQLPIKSRAGSQALGDACRLRENMEYRVHSLKARRSNVAVTSKWKLPNKFLPCYYRFSVRVGLMLLYPYSYHDQLQLHLSRYPLGMRRYLLWAVVVHKYIPNAASYLQANQQPIFPNYCKWTAGPPLSFQVPSTVGVFASLCWAGLELQFHVPFGSLLLLALTGSAARIKSLRFHLGTKHRDYSPGSNTVASSSVHRPAIPGIAMDCQVPVVLCCAVLCCTRYRRDKDEAGQSLPSRAVFCCSPI